MKTSDILYAGDQLTLRYVVNQQQGTLLFSGECDFRDPTEVLGSVFKSLAAELSVRRLVIDFCDLSYMNSASVTPVVVFIKNVVTKACHVELIYSSEISWQRTTASAMRSLINSMKILTVSLRGAAGNVG